MAQELDAGTSILSATPIAPQERGRADHERVEQHADLARLFGGTALPLTLLAERTGAATADAGRIHHPRASIGFPTPLVDRERMPYRAAQRPIWLQGKLATREAAGASCAEPPLVAHILAWGKPGRTPELAQSSGREQWR